MTLRYVLSPSAQADIEEIWDYTVEHWGVEQAARYVRELKAAIEVVAVDPGRGRSCDEIRAGYKRFPAGSHILFYRLTGAGIDVVRILHRRMDFGRHLL
jgi:toxin ParE1/3/4